MMPSKTAYFMLICTSLATLNEALPGTTPHVRDIFLGKCFEFRDQKKHIFPEVMNKNCTQLYETFLAAVDSKDTCKGQYSTIFDDFFKDIDTGLTPNNKALFWSGTMDFAHDLSTANPNYITLEDTFPGYIVNGMNFCPGDKPNSFNFTSCKCIWPESASSVFWRSASKQFATNAQGFVKVFVNGTRRDKNPAYRKNSFFAEVELPNINSSRVKSMNILVGLDVDVKPRETCKKGSIVEMQKDIKKRGIMVNCEDNPSVVFHTICVNSPSSDVCKVLQKSAKKQSSSWKLAAIILAALAGVLLVLFATAMVKICRSRSSAQRLF